MGGRKDRKIEQLVSALEAARFLRHVADELERGRLVLGGEDVDASGPVKIHQELERDSERMTYELKLRVDKRLAVSPRASRMSRLGSSSSSAVRSPAGGEVMDKAALAKLKKRLQARLGGVKRAVNAGDLPRMETARAIYQDCLAMDRALPQCQPDMAVFLEIAQAFLTAVEAGDLPGVRQGMEGLVNQKKACHQRYQ